jgi:hypothetical protein
MRELSAVRHRSLTRCALTPNKCHEKMVPVKAHSSPRVIRLEGDQRAMSDALAANDQFVPSMNTGTGKPDLYEFARRSARPRCCATGLLRRFHTRRGHLEVELEAASPLVSLR